MGAPTDTSLPPPAKSLHPVDVGLRTEAAILAELVRRGYEILVPFGTNHRYDLVLDLDGEFVRAQCKTGRLRNGVIRYSARSTRISSSGIFTRGYRGEIEVFLIYCDDTRQIYAVPVDEMPRRELVLTRHPGEQAIGLGRAEGNRPDLPAPVPGEHLPEAPAAEAAVRVVDQGHGCHGT